LRAKYTKAFIRGECWFLVNWVAPKFAGTIDLEAPIISHRDY
jgi:hypothetical protein